MIITDCVLNPRLYTGDTEPPASLEDISRYGNNGTHTAITWERIPSGLWIRSMNGTSSRIEGSATLWGEAGKMVYAFTMCCWVRFDSIAAIETIFNNGTQTNPTMEFWLYYNSPNLCMDIGDGTNYYTKTQAWAPTVGKWYHVGHTFDNNAGVFYIDGAGTATTAWGTTHIKDCSRSFLIGAYNSSSPSNFLHGDIGQPEIWAYKLTPAQMDARFQSERERFGR